MNIKEIADRLMSEGLIKKKEDHRGYSIYKYVAKVFYNNLWTPELQLFRGLVMDGDKVIVHPLLKVFNYGENNTGAELPDNTPVIADAKINGFMLNVTRYKGELLFSTTGSLNSEFVKLGTKYFYKQANPEAMPEGLVFTFEVVAPEDPHIVSETEGLHLLAVLQDGKHLPLSVRNNYAEVLGVHPVAYQETTLGEVKKRNGEFEGFMIYSIKEELLFKIKTKHYITKKFLMRNKRALQRMEDLDEEFYGIYDFVKDKEYDTLSPLLRRALVEEFVNQSKYFTGE
ncbi:MAG: hypothetical protein ACRCUJ_07515 [Phocaeicola sp.]